MRCGVVAVLLLTVGCGAEPTTAVAEPHFQQWKLPKKLREISGLATFEGRLFTHDDQLGIVYEIDYRDGRLQKAFALGRPTVKDDFEGIAVVAGTFYLVNSDGTLYEFNEGANGQRVGYQRFRTGLGKRCEVEGLAYHPVQQVLLLACKQARVAELEPYVSIYAWSVADKVLGDAPWLQVPLTEVPRDGSDPRFNPSGLVVRPNNGKLMLVAARQSGLLELSADGRVERRLRLPASRHRQAEGLELLPDGRVVIADEGGNQRARLTIYDSLPQ